LDVHFRASAEIWMEGHQDEEGRRRGALELRAVPGPVQLRVAFPAALLDEVGQPADPGASDISVLWEVLQVKPADAEQMKDPPPRDVVPPALLDETGQAQRPKGAQGAKERPVWEPLVRERRPVLPPKEPMQLPWLEQSGECEAVLQDERPRFGPAHPKVALLEHWGEVLLREPPACLLFPRA
jgi:hypothetical protein